jgi:hypothetical protein
MAVTKSVHALVAPWNVAQLADAFRDAFIAAGLMGAWHDSFTSGGYEHRILEIDYDNTKTYGKCYYHFMFTGVSVHLKVYTGWNATDNFPKGPTDVGEMRKDWAAPTTASAAVDRTNEALPFLTLSGSINRSVTRYTAGGRTFFVLRSATTWFTFTIDPAGTTFRTWYQDALVGAMHAGFWAPQTTSQTIIFNHFCRTKRTLFGGVSYDDSLTNAAAGYRLSAYEFQSILTDVGVGRYRGGFNNNGASLPHWDGPDMNNGVLSTFYPVFNGLRPGVIYAADLPNDFGVGGLRGAASNTITIQDTMVVTAGVEEYEVLAFNNSGNTTGAVAPLFLARTVG